MTIAFIFPVILGLFADIDWGALGAAELGFFLMIGVYTSIGLFASSLASSPTLAVVLALVLNLSLYLLTGVQWNIETPLLAELAIQLDVVNQVNGFLKGELHLAGLLSALSFVVIFIFLAERMLESEKWR